MKKEAKIKSSNLNLVLGIIVVAALLTASAFYAFNYYKNTELGYRPLNPGNNVKEARVIGETCYVELEWNVDFYAIDTIIVTFYDSNYNKYDYITYIPTYHLEINASDIGLRSFEKIEGVEARYYYEAFPSPNETDGTINEAISSLLPRKGVWGWIKELLS